MANVHACGHDVDHGSDVVCPRALVADFRGPMRDQRQSRATLVHLALVVAGRRVGNIRQWNSEALMVYLRAGHDGGVVADRNQIPRLGACRNARALPGPAAFLRASPIVGQEQDQTTLELSPLLESVDDQTDHLVHELCLGRIDLHATCLPLPDSNWSPRKLRRVSRAECRKLVDNARVRMRSRRSSRGLPQPMSDRPRYFAIASSCACRGEWGAVNGM